MSTGLKYVVVPRDINARRLSVKNLGPEPVCSIGDYSHVLVVYNDGSFGIVAVIYGAIGQDETIRLAKRISLGLPVEIDRDFYRKQTSKK